MVACLHVEGTRRYTSNYNYITISKASPKYIFFYFYYHYTFPYFNYFSLLLIFLIPFFYYRFALSTISLLVLLDNTIL